MSAHDVVSQLQFQRHLSRERPETRNTPLEQEAHELEAVHPEHGVVGTMSLRARRGGGRAPGHIDDVWVDPAHQRKGVATALWRHANELAEQKVVPRPKHSPQRTHEGDAWARKVGGPLPRSPEHPR